jgi:exodeoxyribonuclease X
MTVYAFDTETTDKHEGEIIEAALVRLPDAEELFPGGDSIGYPFPYLECTVTRFRPSKPMTMGALAVHHILPSELEDCAPSHSFRLPDDCTVILGHSIDFDWQAAGSPQHIKRICTHAMSQWVWPEATGYSQSALIYMLNGATPATRELLRSAHSAGVDLSLNVRILSAILEARPEIRTWSALWNFSEECRIPRTCPMKKFEGVPLDELVENEAGFVDWCLRQSWLDPYFRRGLEREIEKQFAPAEPATSTPQPGHVKDCACADCIDEMPF